MRKTTKIILIIAGILTIVGLAISVSGMAMTGFQWDQLSILSPYQDKESAYDSTKIKRIFIQNTNQTITWKRSNDDKIHLTCLENKYEFYQITQPDSETLKIELISRTPWYQNLFNFDFYDPNLIIEIPEQFQGAAEINSTNGEIRISDSAFSPDLSISTESGSVFMNNTQISGSLQIHSSSGDINLESVSADQYHIQTISGDIFSALIGSSLDYTISAYSQTGTISVPPFGVAKNPFQVSSTSGDIAIIFLP